ncbi:MAG: alpha/beta hydrolase [Gammaproteobacteria bacterium]|nr:alpha/beta hydrolase [Gammaproteobacteria bacterium]
MNAGTVVLLIIVFLVATVLVSYVVEALRAAPPIPEKLSWAPDIPIRYTDLNGIRTRYIVTGNGPALVLLHTLRTQLDIFQKVIPALSKHFTVYALDYPGHGYSDIPQTEYVPDLFVNTVNAFLDTEDLQDVMLAGVSIGGTIPLLIAAQGNQRVKNVVSINPYDYGAGAGVGRGNAVAKVVVTLSKIPVIGATVMRLRNSMVERKIFEGGVSDPASLSPEFAKELFLVGTRKGHYVAFMNLLNNAPAWEQARLEYQKIRIPVLLVYGNQDWSTAAEREQTEQLIPGVRRETVMNGGHFLTLDRPQEVERLIIDFA